MIITAGHATYWITGGGVDEPAGSADGKWITNGAEKSPEKSAEKADGAQAMKDELAEAAKSAHERAMRADEPPSPRAPPSPHLPLQGPLPTHFVSQEELDRSPQLHRPPSGSPHKREWPPSPTAQLPARVRLPRRSGPTDREIVEARRRSSTMI